MIKMLLVLIFLTSIAAGHLGHLAPDNGCNPYIGIIPDMENMTFEEVIFVLGPAYGFNITRDGLLTFENGTQIQIVLR